MFVNALEGTLVLRKALDYETLSNFTVNIRAQVTSTGLNLSTLFSELRAYLSAHSPLVRFH